MTLEVDLLVLRPGATGHLNLIFQPEDILCALEVKNSGAYGERTCEIVRENFNLISEACQGATCAYIAISEQANYKHAVTPQKPGVPSVHAPGHNGPRRPEIVQQHRGLA